VAKVILLGIAIIAALGAGPVAYSQAATQTYRLTDLNAPPNQSLVFTAINNSRQLTGGFTPSGASEMHVFIFDNGNITDLGALGALGPASSATGFSINASAQVAGTATGTLTEQAFLSSGGTLTGLGALPGGGSYSTGAGINDAGQVTGYSFTTSTGNYAADFALRHAFSYANGAMTDLGTLTGQGYSYGTGINASGEVVGGSSVPVPAGSQPGNYEHGFIYSNGMLIDLDPSPFAPASYANAINAAQQVAGALGTPGGATAPAEWVNGLWEPLGPALSAGDTALAINYQGENVAGQIVGIYGGQAFLANNGIISKLIELVDPTDPLAASTTLQSAFGINDSGVILAKGQIESVTHYFLVTKQTLIFTPLLLQFQTPPVLINTTSPPQAVTVSNQGTTAVPISAVSVAGGYSQSNNCGATLAAGATCAVEVSFSPTDFTQSAGVLTVTSSGGDYVVPLSGTVAITVQLSANTQGVTLGSAVTFSWTGTPGISCQGESGTPNDGWSAPLPSSGSKTITPTMVGFPIYIIACTGGPANASSNITIQVVAPPPPAAPAGGGGAIDLFYSILLACVLAGRTISRAQRPMHRCSG